MRLDKLLSNLKYGSRSDIKKYVKEKRVFVNGEAAKDSGMDINIGKDVITFDSLEVFCKENIYLMLNKPKGYICANRDGLHKTVLDLIGEPYSRYDLIIVGRLDIDTEGLLLLTNDGMWAHNIISPKNEHYKKYYVRLRDKLANYEALLTGVTILDGENKPYLTKKAFIEPLGQNECYISICEGKFHQVKRMFEYINNEVVYLKRVSIANLELGDLQLGEYKEINKDDVL